MRYMIFGESHGPAIGVVLEGVPAGLALDLDFIRAELARRAPGQSAMTTARKEKDEPEILSGVFEGKTTGTPCVLSSSILDTRSKDYAKLKDLPRPGHADYAGFVRYHGCNDYRGGRALLRPTHGPPGLRRVSGQAGSAAAGRRGGRPHLQRGRDCRSHPGGDGSGHSGRQGRPGLGGEGASAAPSPVFPPDWGAPDFGCNVEGIFSQYLFAVPAVKAVGFGLGTALRSPGQSGQRRFYMDGDTVRTRTNHTGGVNGASPTACRWSLRSPSVPPPPSPGVRIPWTSPPGPTPSWRSLAAMTPASSPGPSPSLSPPPPWPPVNCWGSKPPQ